MKSPFSCAVQARLKTSLQLRLNHFSTLAASVKRLGLAAGARGRMSLLVLACLPAASGESVWQDAQDSVAPLVL